MTQPIAKKSLGQHWLSDESTLEAICNAADLQPSDTVLEIGPGTGTLTAKLLERAGRVIAVEKDKSLIANLQNRFTHELIAKNLQLVSEDILRFDFGTLPGNYKVVANIPYYLTSNLIRVLSETPNHPAVAVLLLQKEVAERIAAKPGDMSLLSVSAQFYWEVSLGVAVPAKLFTPPPKVDSQVLILSRKAGQLFEVDERQFFRLAKAGFAARRKTLTNSLAGGLRIDKQQIGLLLRQSELEPSLRAQALSLDDWHRLYKVCKSAGIL